MEQNVSPPIYLFAFLSALFAPCLCERGHFMEVSGQRKYFYLAINGWRCVYLSLGNNVHSIIMDIKQLVDWVLLSWSVVNPSVCVLVEGHTLPLASSGSKGVGGAGPGPPLPPLAGQKKGHVGSMGFSVIKLKGSFSVRTLGLFRFEWWVGRRWPMRTRAPDRSLRLRFHFKSFLKLKQPPSSQSCD